MNEAVRALKERLRFLDIHDFDGRVADLTKALAEAELAKAHADKTRAEIEHAINVLEAA